MLEVLDAIMLRKGCTTHPHRPPGIQLGSDGCVNCLYEINTASECCWFIAQTPSLLCSVRSKMS